MILLSFALSINVIAAGSFTFKIEPENPVVGEEAKYYLYTWVTAQDGEPDFSKPFNMAGYPFDIRAYKGEEFPGSYAPGDNGIPIEVKQIDENVWSGDVVFPEEGIWFIVLRNNYPPLTQTTPPQDQAILEVQVINSGGYPPINIVKGCIAAIALIAVFVFVIWSRRKPAVD